MTRTLRPLAHPLSLSLLLLLSLLPPPLCFSQEVDPLKFHYEYICSFSNYPFDIHYEHDATDICGNNTAQGQTSPGVVSCGQSRENGPGQEWKTTVNCSTENGCTVEGWMSCGALGIVHSYYSLHCPGTSPGAPVGHQVGLASGSDQAASCQNSDGTGQRTCFCDSGSMICAEKQ